MSRLNAFHLNGLRAVEAVARCGSLQRAAAELGVSASAVSQQINRTERQLGRSVFHRSANGLVPTPFGEQLSRRLSAGFRELSDAVALADDAASSTLVVSVAPVFAARWLMPRLSRHFKRHPDVLLRIDASPNLIDFDRSDVSAAVRLGTGSWPGVTAKLLFEVEEFPVCVPEIAASLESISDLAKTWSITDDNSMVGWKSWFAAAGAEPVTMLPGAHFSDPMLCLESVLAGHGVMLGWDLLAGEALASGRLVAPFGVKAATGLGYYAVTPDNRRPDTKTANFVRWLMAEVEVWRAPRVAGTRPA